MAQIKIGAVLMCAGLSSRFKSNKLLYDFWGEPLIKRYARVFPKDAFYSVSAVVSDKSVELPLNRQGFKTVWNEAPEKGQNGSIRLGLSALPDVDACMFTVCDQPLLSPGTISGMARSYTSGALTLSFNGQISNPVIIPGACFNRLMNLPAGKTGRYAIEQSGVKMNFFDAECAAELMDADTLTEMQQIEDISNIFLTGPKDTGKSTILFEALYAAGAPTTGFLTLPIGNKQNNEGYCFHGFEGTVTRSKNDMPISEYIDGRRVPVLSTFEIQGVECLKNARRQNKFIIMDELGTLEENCQNFKNEVKECLNSDAPVFGVLRDSDSPFLNEIKSCPDTRVIRVRKKGDPYAYDELKRAAEHLIELMRK